VLLSTAREAMGAAEHPAFPAPSSRGRDQQAYDPGATCAAGPRGRAFGAVWQLNMEAMAVPPPRAWASSGEGSGGGLWVTTQSCPAKAGHPVPRDAGRLTGPLRDTGSSAFADDDSP